MCDKCVELAGKIEHYERISASISDHLTIDRIAELVEQMKAQKAALHPSKSKAASIGGLFHLQHAKPSKGLMLWLTERSAGAGRRVIATKN